MNNKVYTVISIADIHFGCNESPEYMYNQLKIQFINKLYKIDFDIISVCGDLFDSKFMSNNIAITYAILFIDDLVKLCSCKNATLILLAGTLSHDANQLSLFYHYMNDPSIDVRIIEKIQFEDIKGIRVLCIPELYGISEEEYNNILYYSSGYDVCFLHGTYKNESGYRFDVDANRELDDVFTNVVNLITQVLRTDKRFKNAGTDIKEMSS